MSETSKRRVVSKPNSTDEFGSGEFHLPLDATSGDFEYRVARLAWEEGLSSNTILERLRWPKTAENITKIRRALEKAVRHGLVELKPPRNKQLEDSLRQRFPGLKEVHVQVDRAAACLDAARLIAAEIDQFIGGPEKRMVIANAGGGTVRDAIGYLQRLVPVPPRATGKTLIFLSLNAAEAHDSFDQCANFISVRLAQIYAGDGTQHFALVKPWDEKTGNEYRERLQEIDLLISSAGSRVGFLSNWLGRRNKALPDRAVGDVAFHLIDKKGKQVVLDDDIRPLLEEELARAPDWEELLQLFIKKKVLLILAGDKIDVGQALLGSALAQRCIIDSGLATAMLRGVQPLLPPG